MAHGLRIVGQSLQAQPVAQEVGAGQVVGRGEAFGQEAERRARRPVVRLAEDLDAAAVERAEIQQAFDQAGLAGAVDADQAEAFAGAQLQVHAAQHAGRAVAFGDLLDAQGWVVMADTVAHPSKESDTSHSRRARFLA
jgi:uncharacterized protein YdiU (UPF0061 family)